MHLSPMAIVIDNNGDYFDNHFIHFSAKELYYTKLKIQTNEEALAILEVQPYVKNFVENDMDKLCEKVTWHEVNVIA
ncbi:hypothetical protein [Coxiella burnetii]|uniref:hypothetical protein n=2 Tax=Coxiella burnetii TaxID=777 RepID=UPI001557836F|nr:hypothetical protein [Coxiella burnetii]MCF2112277.1 hypothetical protein [Coxiella burnetii]